MHLFLNGIGCVGKSTIGLLVAQKLGIEFHSVDYHVEKFYGKSIERIQNECIGNSSYNYRYSEALLDLLKNLSDTPSVIELPPNGLRYKCWRVVKKASGITVVIHDTAENILKRIVFYDIDTKPMEKILTEREKVLYLKDIRKDITFYKTSQSRADFQVDISGLTPDSAADKVISTTGFTGRLCSDLVPRSKTEVP